MRAKPSQRIDLELVFHLGLAGDRLDLLAEDEADADAGADRAEAGADAEGDRFAAVFDAFADSTAARMGDRSI